MSNALIASTGGKDAVESFVERPKTTPHEDMLASIARTSFIGSGVRIPLISAAALKIGNEKIFAAHGDEARKLLIVGPDAVKTGPGESQIIQGLRAAELLGLIIAQREVTSRSVYFGRGFFANAGSEGSRSVSHATALNWLTDNVLDDTGRPIVTRKGIRGGGKYGIDDVIVKDIRHTNSYSEAREASARILFEEYILYGGQRPTMTEPGAPQGARTVMRKLGGNLESESQMERFVQISQQAADMITHRTDEYDEENLLINSTHTEIRRSIADMFDPPWQAAAACADMCEPFYPPQYFERKDEKLEREAKAKAICSLCPVKKACLESALANREPAGVWGGMNEKERKEYLAGQ